MHCSRLSCQSSPDAGHISNKDAGHISNQASSFSYFTDGLKTIEHFGTYVQELTIKLNHIRTEQDDEKRSLIEIRNSLKNSPGFNKMVRLILDIGRCMR